MKTKSYINLIVILFAWVILYSCAEENAQQEVLTSEEVELEPEIPKPIQMEVWVDHLNVRNSPSLDSDTQFKLAEGAVVTFNHEISEDSISTSLRGKKVRGPFYKIVTKNGKSGWVFSGALKAYSGETIEDDYDGFSLLLREGHLAYLNLNDSIQVKDLEQFCNEYDLVLREDSASTPEEPVYLLLENPVRGIQVHAISTNEGWMNIERVELDNDMTPDQYGVRVGMAYSAIKSLRKNLVHNSNQEGQTFAYGANSSILYEICCPEEGDGKENYSEDEIKDWTVKRLFLYPKK